MFSDKLTELMKVLNVSNKQLSEYSGLDASSLSRLARGSRIPTSDSVTVGKIVNGLYIYAEATDKKNVLCSLVGANESDSPESIKADMLKWMFLDHPKPKQSSKSCGDDSSKASKSRTLRRKFGARFNDVMVLAGMSNIVLSRKAYVDPSLISRYRSGLRSPANNPEVAELLSSIIFKQIEATGRITELAMLMDTRPDSINELAFNRWLYANELQQSIDVNSTKKLLTAFESFTLPENIGPVSDLDNILSESDEDDFGKDQDLNTYFGIKGLCSAVIRFLKDAVDTGAKKLFLFSNQNMDWMTENPAFLAKWALLMKACVMNGTEICIIHNIDRSYEEMNSAIIAWLPLYMSGRINPYYCTLPTGALFYQTLFLNPGRACIYANLVAGTEKTGLYRYYTETEPLMLDSMMLQYNAMLSHCRPLVEILRAEEADMSDFADSEDLRIIQPTLSIMSMPKSDAASFDSPEIMNRWNSYESLSRTLTNSRIYECVTLNELKSVSEGMAVVEAVPGASDIRYTADAYRDHINNIISIMNNRPGYRLIALPEAPFSNMQLIISDERVRITRTAPPLVSFTFTHPQMCHAFKNYSDRLIKQYMTDRRTLTKLLSDEYLS
jgi:hypothetical protein